MAVADVNLPSPDLAGVERRRGRPDDDQLDLELAGLDALERPLLQGPSRLKRVWSGTWPKLAALAIALVAWQAIVWSGWRPRYILPPPSEVLPRLWEELGKATTWSAIGTTMRRAAIGFALAAAVGVV
ncbi:MAG TPA: hypothetical protein VF855_12625, partial [Acidimicrobiales bacterium]